jgi:hypothetical protein
VRRRADCQRHATADAALPQDRSRVLVPAGLGSKLTRERGDRRMVEHHFGVEFDPEMPFEDRTSCAAFAESRPK